MSIMQVILILLLGFGGTFSLMAQEFPERTADPNLQLEERTVQTNREVWVEETFQNAETDAQIQIEDLDLSAGTNGAAEVSTHQVEQSRVTFLMNTGIQYAEEGEHEEAERAYLRALAEDPDNETIRFRLSTLYIFTERFEEAVSILEELVEDHPLNSQVRNNLAWAYATGEGVRNQKRALLNAREAILSSPISPSLWNTLAEAYYMGGDYEEAERSAKHAIDLMIRTDPEQTQMPSFQAQLDKIQRASRALKRLQGLDDDE